MIVCKLMINKQKNMCIRIGMTSVQWLQIVRVSKQCRLYGGRGTED